MTVSVQICEDSYTADGAATPRSIGFQLIDPTHLTVEVDGEAQILGVDYSISGDYAAGSGSIQPITLWDAGAEVRYYRATPSVQQYDVVPGAALKSVSLELELDRQALRSQENGAALGRALLVPRGESGYVLLKKALRANLYPVFDANGDLTYSQGTGADAGLRGDLAANGSALVGGAVWDSGTTRTMKERATDTYCILDAPGSPDPTGNNASTTALQAMMTEANSSGVRLELTIGDFVTEEPLLIKRTGQVLFGHGMGYGYGRPDYAMRDFVGQSRIIAAGTFATRVATRRKHRASGADPTDDAISVALDIQADGVTLSDFAIWLNTDYTDLTAANYGDDVDVGLLVGCRPGFRLQNVGVFGHFRRHGILFDVTRSLELPELLDWDGNALPAGASGETFSGGDGTLLINPFVYGSLGPSLAILGAIHPGTDYYDAATGAIPDTRGASGFSDFECFGGRLYGAQHQSGRRTQDPTGYGGALSRSNMEAEADTFPASFYIDGWAGNSASTTHGLGALRNINFYGTRFTSCEAFRIRLGLCDQVKFLGTAWIEAGDSPSGTSQWKDTSGANITISDYANVTYGHIATHQTDTGQVVAQDVVGGLAQTWVYSKQRTRAMDGYGREMMQGLWVRGDTSVSLPTGFGALSHVYDDGAASEYGGQLIESFRPFNYLKDRSSGNAMGWRYDTGVYQLRQGAHSAGSAPANILKTIKENGAEFSGEVTIADDAVASITPPANGGYMMMTFSPDTTGPQRVRSGIVFYDVGASLDIGAVFAGANFTTSTSDVTGTTGVDGNVTVAVQVGVIKIENRGGGSAVFRYTFIN